jgi:hypothetical protein
MLRERQRLSHAFPRAANRNRGSICMLPEPSEWSASELCRDDRLKLDDQSGPDDGIQLVLSRIRRAEHELRAAR